MTPKLHWFRHFGSNSELKKAAMRSFSIRYSLCFVCLVCVSVALWSPKHVRAQISATISTDKTSYIVGEPIDVTVSAVNSSPSPITLTFPSSLQSQYVLDNTYVNNQLGLAIFTYATVPAHGTLDYTWP